MLIINVVDRCHGWVGLFAEFLLCNLAWCLAIWWKLVFREETFLNSSGSGVSGPCLWSACGLHQLGLTFTSGGVTKGKSLGQPWSTRQKRCLVLVFLLGGLWLLGGVPSSQMRKVMWGFLGGIMLALGSCIIMTGKSLSLNGWGSYGLVYYEFVSDKKDMCRYTTVTKKR